MAAGHHQFDMNAKSNKKRGPSNRGGRGKGGEKSLPTEGVYSNHRFLHTVATLTGLPIQILTTSNEIYEGILTTFGPNFHMAIDLPHLVSPLEPALITSKEVSKKFIFRPEDIVTIKVINVDMEFATAKEGFATDSAIASRMNGSTRLEKELEPWIEEDCNC